jgi:hypothetical protein
LPLLAAVDREKDPSLSCTWPPKKNAEARTFHQARRRAGSAQPKSAIATASPATNFEHPSAHR